MDELPQRNGGFDGYTTGEGSNLEAERSVCIDDEGVRVQAAAVITAKENIGSVGRDRVNLDPAFDAQ